jgi:predicted DNA-binding transcriptional regulator AlpA
MRKREPAHFGTNLSARQAERRARQSLASVSAEDQRQGRWVTGPALRKMFDISAVTLWRWRHGNGFPTGKRINGRLYFPWREVDAWLKAQPDVA